MAITVRPIQTPDRQAWERLFRDYIAFYRANVPDSVIDLTFQRMVGLPREIVGLLAVDDNGSIVGFALAILHRSTWSASWYCYLEDLYVDPAHRGSGAGRALIEAVYREADAAGATRTYWVTENENTRARALYDRVAKLAPFVQYRR